MEWTPPRRHLYAKVAGVEAPLLRGASMGEVSIIGLDLVKNVFQAPGAEADGSVVFRRKLSRSQLLKFIAAQMTRPWRQHAWLVRPGCYPVQGCRGRGRGACVPCG